MMTLGLAGVLLGRNDDERNLHPWMKVDQAVRPLPPKSLRILVGLALKLISLCNHN